MRRFTDLFRAKKESPVHIAPPESPVKTASPEPPVKTAPVEPPVSAASVEPPVNRVSEGSSAGTKDIEGRVVEILRNTFDPEIPVNIYELGLIYEIRVDDPGAVYIKMTLTSPACPVAGTLPPEVEYKVRAIPGVTDVQIDLVWDPPWNPSRMSEAARLQLGMM